MYLNPLLELNVKHQILIIILFILTIPSHQIQMIYENTLKIILTFNKGETIIFPINRYNGPSEVLCISHIVIIPVNVVIYIEFM